MASRARAPVPWSGGPAASALRAPPLPRAPRAVRALVRRHAGGAAPRGPAGSADKMAAPMELSCWGGDWGLPSLHPESLTVMVTGSAHRPAREGGREGAAAPWGSPAARTDVGGAPSCLGKGRGWEAGCWARGAGLARSPRETLAALPSLPGAPSPSRWRCRPCRGIRGLCPAFPGASLGQWSPAETRRAPAGGWSSVHQGV